SPLITVTLSPKPFRAAFCSARAQSSASISTAVTSTLVMRAARQRPATPTPAPASSTRAPLRAETAAARNTASLPALCPPRGWMIVAGPPRRPPALGAVGPPLTLLFFGDDMADAGLGEDAARPPNLSGLY